MDRETGQVDSLELLETPEITEMTKNLTKITKYLTKFKETLAVTIKFSVDSTFSNMFYSNKQKPGNAGNQQKAF